jgi:hypothetical protein
MNFQEILDNNYVQTFLILFMVVYGAVVAPELPLEIKKLFDNSVFKMIVIFLIVVLVQQRTTTGYGILVAVVFVLSLNYLSAKETFENITGSTQLLQATRSIQEAQMQQTNSVLSSVNVSEKQVMENNAEALKCNVMGSQASLQASQAIQAAQATQRGYLIPPVDIKCM